MKIVRASNLKGGIDRHGNGSLDRQKRILSWTGTWTGKSTDGGVVVASIVGIEAQLLLPYVTHTNCLSVPGT